MAGIERSTAALRIFGDELVPEEIGELLGCPPTHCYRKGEVKVLQSGHELKRKTGMWLLAAAAHEPENLDKQVAETLARLAQDLAVWESLSERFEIDLYCGLFMKETNEGLSLSPATLRALADRRIKIGLDIYAPLKDITNDEPCPCGSGKSYCTCCALQHVV